MKKCILNRNSKEYKTLTSDFYNNNYKHYYNNIVRFNDYLKNEDLQKWKKLDYIKEIRYAETCSYALQLVFHDTFKETIRAYEKRQNINDSYNVICKIINNISEV